MTNPESEKILDRLRNNYQYNRFNEPAVMAEYKRILAKYGYEQMNRAIDSLIDGCKDDRNAPMPPMLIKACRENPNISDARNETRCDVCNDKGYILTKEVIERNAYEFVYYCPFCQIGKSQAYNGSNCKEGKTNAVCLPITEIMDEQAIAQLRYTNNHQQAMTDAEKEELRGKLARMGLRMPAVLNRGDAWEGKDESCPF